MKITCKLATFALLGGLILPLSMPGATGTGGVQGSVVDETGKPVNGARVFISQALPQGIPHPSAPPVITGPQMTARPADASGIFKVTGLPEGQYVACAETATPGLLDPCHWGTSAPTFTVTAGQTANNIRITMLKGAVLAIRLNDPLALLKSPNGAVDSNCQFHVVTQKGHHYGAVITAQNTNSRDHAITVPSGSALSLQVISPHLVVNDGSGKPVPPGGIEINIAAGANTTQMNFSVAGSR